MAADTIAPRFSVRPSCVVWRRNVKKALRRVGFWRSPRCMMARRVLRAAMIGGVGLQMMRDWVLQFNERGPDGLLNEGRRGTGQAQRRTAPFLARMMERGPIPAVHGVVRWRLIDLAQWILEEFRIAIAEQTLSRELRAMGFRMSPHGRAITRKPRARWRILKKLPRAPGRNRA